MQDSQLVICNVEGQDDKLRILLWMGFQKTIQMINIQRVFNVNLIEFEIYVK